MNIIIKLLMVIFISYPLHTYSINIDKSINSHVDVSFSSMEQFTHTLTAVENNLAKNSKMPRTIAIGHIESLGQKNVSYAIQLMLKPPEKSGVKGVIRGNINPENKMNIALNEYSQKEEWRVMKNIDGSDWFVHDIPVNTLRYSVTTTDKVLTDVFSVRVRATIYAP
ncbi:Saf-pilin pilus formation protein SafA [Yersinia intermedia]|uniref:hypothetical protein n=1 Tax=Yersinia intermedia TaxID=631 RepID=UPI0005E72E8E|nr:hypothetical protein [Yersinia intermedia]CND04461.1 Saf-pilin pilus formation protein SafA [Yersinia intermedia]CNH38186.1 Saf-pilin pilus formation protein SafA [Yersinia intermedia]